jgi:hypothetical protein
MLPCFIGMIICRDAIHCVRCLERKEACEIMPAMKSSNFLTLFQQIFADFCCLMTEICIFLSFCVLASKFQKLLITTEASNTKKSNRIQTNFDSNVHIATFDHEPSAPKNKQLQTLVPILCVSISLRLCVKPLSFAFAEMLKAEMLTCSVQTEFKGNFCLIIIYGHKTKFRTQLLSPKSQTFSNFSCKKCPSPFGEELGLRFTPYSGESLHRHRPQSTAP